MSSFGAFSKYLGPRYQQLAKNWLPTAALFGGSAVLMLLYVTEWKLVLQFVPIYNSKFKAESVTDK